MLGRRLTAQPQEKWRFFASLDGVQDGACSLINSPVDNMVLRCVPQTTVILCQALSLEWSVLLSSRIKSKDLTGTSRSLRTINVAGLVNNHGSNPCDFYSIRSFVNMGNFVS